MSGEQRLSDFDKGYAAGYADAARAAAPSPEGDAWSAGYSQGWDEGRAAGPTFPPAPVPAAGLREALVDAMEAHEDGRRGGAYPHLGQTNDIRRFVDWIVDWMEKFTPDALFDTEQEAASKAVAEVLDRLEHRVRANYGTLPTGDRVCALIASERER